MTTCGTLGTICRMGVVRCILCALHGYGTVHTHGIRRTTYIVGIGDGPLNDSGTAELSNDILRTFGSVFLERLPLHCHMRLSETSSAISERRRACGRDFSPRSTERWNGHAPVV
ncbi:hypothetical protein ACRALDRAFT_2061351 [Sodiomyces alcalophilus JCM 7366]|uniref:uncharacterized protein n=1 Tax=Sodiomyces alcalophilus JCM 7366 TaxID=591952 RepID=UPI0039B3C2D1